MPWLLLGALLAQAAAPSGQDDTALRRIRQALAAPPPVLTIQTPVDVADTRVFRVKVRGWTFTFPVWHEDSTVPSYVRPTMPPVHFEFLQQVTPEFFRSSVLYPGAPRTPYGGVSLSVDLIPVFEALNRRMKAGKKRADEEAARAEVREAMARLLACRADPSRAGC
jgi:hypothetical protein